MKKKRLVFLSYGVKRGSIKFRVNIRLFYTIRMGKEY
jgi:hypothetical protein